MYCVKTYSHFITLCAGFRCYRYLKNYQNLK
uniref:Uncharacterized protein n=1 Tax=Siphoviridae sp. ctTC45 TaxID=2827573 RepID=A0A8S5LQV2_9CAUD|nr:MAG TPA: hypothetical protein [Siphoviridae sp. ctTC45]